tara:strand:+ start:175 stop:1098 length:924 start_codon:yes stop_codon:yes gene_type:complete
MTSQWHGSCDLRLFKQSRSTQIDNIKTIHQAQCTAPLKLMKVFHDKKDGRCEVPILHSAGGIVGGDQLTININAEENSSATCSSVAAQKVYGSRGRSKLNPKGTWANQKCLFQIEKDADFEWIPQELIIYQGGLFEQNMTVKLDPSSSFLCVDLVRLGRTAAGEKLGSGVWRSSLEIFRDDSQGKHYEFNDRLELSGEALKSFHGLEDQPVFGSLTWITPKGIKQKALSDLLVKCREQRNGLDGFMTCSLLENGISARYTGSSTQSARFWFYRIWSLTRVLRELKIPEYMRFWPMQENPSTDMECSS